MTAGRQIRDYQGVAALFLLSTAFFLSQHATGVSWDFSVYVLNARYLAYDGFYFEWERPPLMPVLVAVFGLMGQGAAENLYIVFSSGLFALACVRFARSAGVDTDLFYALMLSPFLLNYGLFAGTELMTLALLMLALSDAEKMRSSAYIGLSMLARYQSLVYAPMLLFLGDRKKVLAGLGVIALLLIPWLAYNHAVKGHPFYSMYSSYLFNMTLKEAEWVGPGFESFPVQMIVYAPLALLGVMLRKRRGFGRIDKVVAAFFTLSLISYMMLSVREIRYVMNLLLPVGFYACAAVQELAKDTKKRRVLFALFVMMNFTASSYFIGLRLPDGFAEGVNAAGTQCMLMSNMWPHINYAGVPTMPHPMRNEVPWALAQGRRLILFYGSDVYEPDYRFDARFMGSLPVLAETEDYVVLGYANKCAPPGKVEKSYIEYYRMQGNDLRMCPVLPLTC